MSMISKNTNWKELNSPFLLAPVGKDYLWGGVRLRTEYHKDIPLEPLAETWECSTHPQGESFVASGYFKGRRLSEILQEHPQWLGIHPRRHHTNFPHKEILPVLVKLIDAEKDLSVQVHPDDGYAYQNEGQPGKMEMWYVLDAKPDAQLIYGFTHDMTDEDIMKSLEQETLLKHLQHIPVQKDDVFMIEPGTVHAIGKGVLLVEIQECSNVTYRLYDYNRLDKNQQKRELHIQQALEVLNKKEQPVVQKKLRVMRYQKGSASEILCRCKYFQVDRVLVGNRYQCVIEDTSFQIFLVLEGELHMGDITAQKGDCVFLPADMGKLVVEGKGQFLKICC